jgi:hypothetical protein
MLLRRNLRFVYFCERYPASQLSLAEQVVDIQRAIFSAICAAAAVTVTLALFGYSGLELELVSNSSFSPKITPAIEVFG